MNQMPEIMKWSWYESRNKNKKMSEWELNGKPFDWELFPTWNFKPYSTCMVEFWRAETFLKWITDSDSAILNFLVDLILETSKNYILLFCDCVVTMDVTHMKKHGYDSRNHDLSLWYNYQTNIRISWHANPDLRIRFLSMWEQIW